MQHALISFRILMAKKFLHKVTQLIWVEFLFMEIRLKLPRLGGDMDYSYESFSRLIFILVKQFEATD